LALPLGAAGSEVVPTWHNNERIFTYWQKRVTTAPCLLSRCGIFVCCDTVLVGGDKKFRPLSGNWGDNLWSIFYFYFYKASIITAADEYEWLFFEDDQQRCRTRLIARYFLRFLKWKERATKWVMERERERGVICVTLSWRSSHVFLFVSVREKDRNHHWKMEFHVSRYREEMHGVPSTPRHFQCLKKKYYI